MAPILAQDESFDQQEDTVLRARWEPNNSECKAVGSHLPIGKRNSTPVGGGGLFSTSANIHQLLQSQLKVAQPAPLENNSHKRLDRSYSEPVKQDTGKGGQVNSSRYKTELCRPYEENGHCKYGDKCQFAHGHAELRTLARHPKYKTELCRRFHTSGYCPYGRRCHFIHNSEERSTSPSSSPTHAPLTASSSLNLGRSNSSAMNVINFLNPSDIPSPPASLHGSPTATGTFFEDSFNVFGSKGLLDELNLGGSISRRDSLWKDFKEEGSFMGLDTPPCSPVESLAGDLDSLSLSVTSDMLTGSPLDISRSSRLHIFEKFAEVQ